jgi:flagellar hook-basal body complex protein FliE
MSQMEIDRVLAQIRSISQTVRPAGMEGVGGNATQAKASDLATKFERGVPGVELPQVMLEMQKANVSFRALTEVRNKFIDAYREIMNMPL